jgi:murein DD-endopeptidase MepM/ murein hydrolase activator NlpD
MLGGFASAVPALTRAIQAAILRNQWEITGVRKHSDRLIELPPLGTVVTPEEKIDGTEGVWHQRVMREGTGRRGSGGTILLVGLALVTLTSAALADDAPWRARRTRGVRPNHMATARVSPSDWPAEPESPAEIDPNRLARAIHALCGWMPPGRPLRYADFLLRSGEEHGEDPFLLGALVYRRTEGSCRPDAEGPHGELGLTQIRREMYADTFRGGAYRYQVRLGGEWRERERRFDRFPFAGPRLARAEENIYFAAALLSAWRDQHLSVDRGFDQVEHRHYVSHFVWGDRVESDRQEDEILTDRRRLLQYYGTVPVAAPVERFGLELGAPLDGAPRVVSSFIGDGRDADTRSHRGVDVESLPSEPVRAVADGTVSFAGVDLPGRQSHEQVALGGYDAYPRRSLGSGGRYVCVRHPREGDDLRTCYMHLEEVHVQHGQEVTRGDTIGTVGRTGMLRSAAHLHLEMHMGSELLDASEVLRGILIGEPVPD